MERSTAAVGLVQTACAAQVLAIPLPGAESHLYVMSTIVDELAARGHEVMVMPVLCWAHMEFTSAAHGLVHLWCCNSTTCQACTLWRRRNAHGTVVSAAGPGDN